MEFKKLNNIIGWVIFAIAAMVYLLTAEPTTSFWDCGEYIATAFKLQVGHPPGAPFFQILGRFFSLFAFGDNSLVARMVNSMSALASAFTILFLFWSITALARKLVEKEGGLKGGNMIAVLGSGMVGALAYTFSDSFWFSAVEGEVYATSSFFTAVTFWAILKWERAADKEHNLRWLILIAFLIGISIGVHLLNLLAIPAVVFVYYFKKKKATRKGVILTFLFSVVLLYLILYIIIPLVVKLAGTFELFFVNTLGMPFHTGTVIYLLFITGLIVWGIYYTHVKRKVIMNTVLLSLTFLLIGYAAFFMLPIRSLADPPIDENNPEDAVSLLSYLNREQYGSTPLIYGHYYNAPLDNEDPYGSLSPIYAKDHENGKYIIVDSREESAQNPNYNDKFCTIFPRMHSDRAPRGGFKAYNEWVNIDGRKVSYVNNRGERETRTIPTFGENLQYFFKYQVGYMYVRYFMWNFVGRQNNIQGFGGTLDGNWLSGINFIDEMRLGPQDNIPTSLQSKARNTYYFLPLILGLIGMLFHFNRKKKDAFVVLLLFFFTGIAIVIYLNQPPNEPRERDYAYAASFYAFAIWIGLGVFALYERLRKRLKPKLTAPIVTLACLVLVPGIMAQQGWDDHDRSNRYTALAGGINYLNSCAPNALIFANGDNDTFPLWYAQEVEGIRTDVRVVNLSLLTSSWYVEMMLRKAYNSDPVPATIPYEKYRQGDFNWTYFFDNQKLKGYTDLKKLIEFVGSDDPKTKFNAGGELLNYFPTKRFSLPIDSAKVVEYGIVPENRRDSILPAINWKLNRSGVMRNHLALLDIIATNEWKRPLHFVITTGSDSYVGLGNYFRLEGLAYRLVPYRAHSIDGQRGEINTDIMYDNMMNKFYYGNMEDPGIFLDESSSRMARNLKNNFGRLAHALLHEGKKDSAIAVCDKCVEKIPDETIPYDRFNIRIAEAYYQAGALEKGNKIFDKLIDYAGEELEYFTSFDNDMLPAVNNKIKESLGVLHRINQMTKRFEQEDLNKRAKEIFDRYYQFLIG